MSVSYYAHAAIGCKVPVEKAKREVQIRGCTHETTNYVFCPYCGRPTWHTYTEWVFPLNDLEEIEVGDGLEAIFSTDKEELIVASLWTEESGYDSECSMALLDQSIETYKSRVQSFLEPLGLWDESLFGLWVVPYVSY